MSFDFFGRTKKIPQGVKTSEEPYLSQSRLRSSLLRLSKRPAVRVLECKTIDEFWNAYFRGDLQIKLFWKDFKLDAAVLHTYMEDLKSRNEEFSRTEHLELFRNNMSDDAFIELASFMLRSPNLLHLQIATNNLTSRSMTTIGPLFAFNKSLLSLVLCENSFSGEGAIAIADFLKINTTLRVLDLSKCGFKNDDIDVLCAALKLNSTLLFLGLSNNSNLDDEVCVAFADLIHENNSLMFLDLSDNIIENDGANLLLEALKHNFSIVDIDLNDTDLDYSDPSDKKVLDELRNLFLRNLSAPKKALEEALKVAKGPWRRSKLMVVGQGAAGKTATVRSLLGMEFREGWESTIGAEVIQSKSRSGGGKGAWIPMEKADIDNHLHDFVSELLITEAGTFLQNLKAPKNGGDENKKEEIRKMLESEQIVDVEKKLEMISGEKIGDMLNEITDEVAVEARSSGKEQIVFSIWDLGGQKVFYTLHHLFMTKFGVYLLIFNPQELLDTKTFGDAVEYIRFWMNCCKLHAPETPVFLVATRSDDLKTGDVGKIDEILRKEISGKFPSIQNNDEKVFFPIDNKSGKGVEDLRKRVFEETEKMAHVNFKVPVFWLGVLDEIHSRAKTFVTLETVLDIYRERTGIKDADLEMVKEMLSFFHQLGLVLHFPSNSILEKIIVLSPQWVIDVLGKVIKDREIHFFNDREWEALKKVHLEKEASRMFSEAKVTRDVLEFLWRDAKILRNHYRKTDLESRDDVLTEQNLIEFFVQLMKKTLLLSDWKSAEEKDDQCFLIPSLLQKPNQKEKAQIKKKQKEIQFRVDFDFSEFFLPIGVFERILCLAVEFAMSKDEDLATPTLFSNCAEIQISKDDEVVLEVEENVISMKMNTREGFNAMNMILTRVKHDAMGSGLLWKTTFFLPDGKLLSMEEAKQQKLAPFFAEEAKAKDVKVVVDIENFLEDF